LDGQSELSSTKPIICSIVMANTDTSFAFFAFVVGGLFIQKALILRLVQGYK